MMLSMNFGPLPHVNYIMSEFTTWSNQSQTLIIYTKILPQFMLDTKSATKLQESQKFETVTHFEPITCNS